LKLNFNGSVIEFFTAAQLRLKAKEFLILAGLLCPLAEKQLLLKQNTNVSPLWRLCLKAKEFLIFAEKHWFLRIFTPAISSFGRAIPMRRDLRCPLRGFALRLQRLRDHV
jgi:hypothetical protein